MENFIKTKYEKFLEELKKEEDKKRGYTYLSRHYKKVAKELLELGVSSPEEYTSEIAIKLANQKFSSIIKEGQIYVSQRDVQRIYMYINFLNVVFENHKIDPHKTKLYSFSPTVCPVCGKKMEFVEKEKFSQYTCEKCKVSQTVAKGSNFPTSSPATKKVRELRKRVFSALNNLFANNSKNKYPFVVKVIGEKKQGSMDNIIAFLDETECNHVLNAINFILKEKKSLEKEKRTRPLWWKLSTNWLKNAKVDDFRWLWLAQNKIRQRLENGMVFYDLESISKLKKVSIEEAQHKLWELYAYGAPISMNIKFIDEIIKDKKGLLDAFDYENVEDFCQKIVRKGYFSNYKPSDIFHIVARYNRVKLLKSLKDISIEDIEKASY